MRRDSALREVDRIFSHNTSLYTDLTALENLGFYSRLMDAPSDEASLIRKIELVGLAGREREPVRNYSRGMQQRLAIARAFLHDPEILLLDEPFTGLDQGGSEFLKWFLAQAHSEGKTCIVAIHDASLGYEMADRLVVIERSGGSRCAETSLTLKEFEERYLAVTQTRMRSSVGPNAGNLL